MSFLPFGCSPGNYSPEQLRMIQEVYSAIAAEPWFVKDAEKRTAFAARVLLMYNRGLIMPDKLRAFCTVLARHHFSEPPSSAEGQTEPQQPA